MKRSDRGARSDRGDRSDRGTEATERTSVGHGEPGFGAGVRYPLILSISFSFINWDIELSKPAVSQLGKRDVLQLVPLGSSSHGRSVSLVAAFLLSSQR